MLWRSSKRIRSARAPVSFIDPCRPKRADRAPSSAGWVHEIKHDGYRMQIHVRDGRVKLYTMTGVDWVVGHFQLWRGWRYFCPMSLCGLSVIFRAVG